MEQSVQTEATLAENITPPPHSRLSLVMNGVGNGMMLGAIPLIAFEGYEMLANKRIGARKIAGALLAGAAALVGGLYGHREARKLDDYRDNLKGQILRMDEKIQQQDATINALKTGWQEKLAAEKAKAPEGPAIG